MSHAELHDQRSADLETRFVGRAETLERLAGELRKDGIRTVTLTGPPGIGKTRLARELVRRLRDRSRRESLVVDASELTGPDELEAAFAERLGIPYDSDRSTERTMHALSGLGDALVVLDDVHHLIGAGFTERVREWLERAPDLTLLLTSRTRLGAEFEVCRELDPLEREAAIDLFEARARRVTSGFRVDDSNRDAVADLVEELDRLPLAVKLAAGRVRILSPSQMLDRLHRPFELLETSDTQAGLRSLRRAIGASWESISDAERDALRQCTVFRGSFTIDAAEFVVELEEGAPSTLAVVESLVDHSLLRTAPHDGPEGEIRLEMLGSIREFARHRLRKPGEVDAVRRRHAAYYRRQCRVWPGHRYDPEFLDWAPTLRPEVENLETAWEWLLEVGDSDAAVLASSLADFLLYRRNRSRVLEVVERTRSQLDLSDFPRERAKLMLLQAKVVDSQGEERRGQRLRREALATLEGTGEARLRCNVRIAVGFTAFQQGILDESESAFEEALETARSRELEMEEAAVLSIWARQRCEEGDLDGAERLLQRALETVRPLDAAYQESRIRINYGTVLYRRGRPEETLEQVQTAVELVERDGVPFQGTTERANLACARSLVGDYDEADAQFERASEMLHRRGLRKAHANTLLDHGLVAVLTGDEDRGREKFREARRLADPDNRAGAFSNLGGAHAGLGLVEAVAGEFDRANEHFERAESFLEEAPSRITARKFERFLAMVRLAAELAAREAGAETPCSPAQLRKRYREIAEGRRESFEEMMAFRLLSDWAGEGAVDVERDGADEDPSELALGPEARWVELDGERMDFSRRGPLRRIVAALADARVGTDGASLSTYDLLERGWPDQDLSPDSGVNRVYTAISRLRDLGFDDVLKTDDTGYHLVEDLAVRIERTD